MKNQRKQNSRTNGNSFSRLIRPLYLLLTTILIINSSCKGADPDFEVDVIFNSPQENAIYYTDTFNASGESLGAEIVNIDIDISSNEELTSLSIQIIDSQLGVAYNEGFPLDDNTFEYSINTTFQTDVPDIYKIYVITTFGGLDGHLEKEKEIFEYKDPITDDDDDDDTGVTKNKMKR